MGVTYFLSSTDQGGTPFDPETMRAQIRRLWPGAVFQEFPHGSFVFEFHVPEHPCLLVGSLYRDHPGLTIKGDIVEGARLFHAARALAPPGQVLVVLNDSTATPVAVTHHMTMEEIAQAAMDSSDEH